MGIIFDFDLYEFCTNFSERFTTCILSRFVRFFLNLNALLRVCYLDLYEFDLYDLFSERFSRTNRGIAVRCPGMLNNKNFTEFKIFFKSPKLTVEFTLLNEIDELELGELELGDC